MGCKLRVMIIIGVDALGGVELRTRDVGPFV